MAVAITCSRILQRNMSGRWVCSWMHCNVNLSYMGTPFALRQSEGTSPVSSEVLKIKVMIGAISIASCFRIIGLILSGPPALCGFKFCSNLRIPGSFTCISGISGYGLGSMI